MDVYALWRRTQTEVFENRVLRRILDLREMKQLEAGENWVIRRCIIRIFMRYYYDDQIKGDEMIGKCSIYGTEEKCIQSFRVSYAKERRHLEDLGVAERYGIKMGLKEVGCVGRDYIHLAQSRPFVGSC